ncbi:MAG: hypothetical protein SNJ57_18820 [Cyanobacteriota bacterium]
MSHIHFGMPQCRDRAYGAAAALSYWAFLCRDRNQSPAKGFEVWRYLDKAIRQSAFPALSLEDYLAELCKRLVVPNLRPAVLTHKIVQPEQLIFRVPVMAVGSAAVPDLSQVQQLDADQSLSILGWQDILRDCQAAGFGDRHILGLCKTQPQIIGAICRFRHIELFGEKATEADEEKTLDAIEVEAHNA